MRDLLFVPALLLLTFSAGCAKKAPQTVPAPPPPVETPAPAPAPADDSDPVEPGLPSDLVELNVELERRGLLGDVYFAFDRATLDETARDRLARNARFLSEHVEYTVTIEGHCDERGTNEYNLALGDRRSSGSRDYLVSLGVDAARLRSMSYGEERPQCATSDETCWAKNRRARFVVTGRTSGS